jgi:hypothetical protein
VKIYSLEKMSNSKLDKLFGKNTVKWVHRQEVSYELPTAFIGSYLYLITNVVGRVSILPHSLRFSSREDRREAVLCECDGAVRRFSFSLILTYSRAFHIQLVLYNGN